MPRTHILHLATAMLLGLSLVFLLVHPTPARPAATQVLASTTVDAAMVPVPRLRLMPEDSTTTTTSTTIPPTTTTTTAPPPRHFATVSRSAPIKPVVYPAGYSTSCWPSVGMAPRNSTEACISSSENGGCYDRSRNASHFGRWQFDYATWTGNTGSGADWGYASPAEQDQVFRYAVDHGGYNRWTKYDGC